MSLNKKYKIKTIKEYAPTSNDIENFFEDITKAINTKLNCLADSAEISIGSYDYDLRSKTRQLLEFLQVNGLYVMNVFF